MTPSEPRARALHAVGVAPVSAAQVAFEHDLARVARSEVTVLLAGEHGAGKSHAARALHRASARAAAPLIEVDLAALAPSLLEAELFGHEEGAFTGASRARVGRFRRAQGGTLVLDGVEGLPREVQGKLLRTLQERQVEPLGAETPIAVDVRVIASASSELGAEVEAGGFREDLYYRLAVVRLDVPPLRVRGEDLPGLTRALALRVAERAGVPAREVSDGALARLARHPWPGNVRELENALERVTVLAPADAGPIDAAELHFLDEAIAGAAERLAAEARGHGLSLDDLARAMLAGALEEARGNLSAAARSVGLSRRAFEYRLAKLRGPGDGKGSP